MATYSPEPGPNTAKLLPANPSSVTVIRNLTPNIITLSAPFARFGRFKVGSRATIVRLSNSTLAVFSPTALTADAHAAVSSLNAPVAYLIAPDYEHHIHLSAWKAAFPSAHVVGVEGLPAKRAADPEVTDIEFHSVFVPPAAQTEPPALIADPAFTHDFEVEYVHAHANKELVFYFKPDRTLIEADLLFNLPPTEQYSRVPEKERKLTLLDRLFASFQNTSGEALWQRRFLWYVASSKDREAFGASVRRIDKWDFERVVPCHGDVIEHDAKGVFRRVMAWYLVGQDAKRKGV